MAILGKFYDETTHTDKVWYDSSNVFYSKFVENENDNKGQLYVTFKNGSTYHYKDVDMPTDYLMFKHGGFDNSQGKTLNKQIKPKYEFERVSDENVQLLQEQLEELNGKPKENNIDEVTKMWFDLKNIIKRTISRMDVLEEAKENQIEIEDITELFSTLKEEMENVTENFHITFSTFEEH